MGRVSLSDLLNAERDDPATHFALSGHEGSSNLTICKGATASAFPDTLATVEELDCVVCSFHSLFSKKFCGGGWFPFDIINIPGGDANVYSLCASLRIGTQSRRWPMLA